MNRVKFWALAVLMSILAVAASVWAQAPLRNPTMPPADAESITVKIIPGVHAEITASSERVTLQHDGAGNTVIFIDTRPKVRK